METSDDEYDYSFKIVLIGNSLPRSNNNILSPKKKKVIQA